MSDIYKGELQDNECNTIYPHTEADVVFCADGKTVQEKLNGIEKTTEGVTGRTDSLEVNDSTKLATSAATHKLAKNQGGCVFSYEDGNYYVQAGADTASKKKLGSGIVKIVELLNPASGSGTIDVSSYPGSEDFTNDNFFVKFITGSSYARFEVEGTYEKSGGSGNLASPSLSYDPISKTLSYNIQTSKNATIYNDGHVSSNTSVSVSVCLCLIYLE